MISNAKDDHSLTRAGEDYLESIYRLSLDSGEPDGSVRSVDVADQLEVSKASVNKALNQLKDMGMVTQSRYGRVTLTSEGEKYAKIVWRSHRALRAFLQTDLGVEPETADEEACLMEHALSADTMTRLIDYLQKQGVKID
ncbi:MAG: metal-dependent transcriptional regulator [Atopobiaceae bacterium]|jgi:DtxR family Mn-dependent transcriptional regulator|uniref:metal-dependent transcriptional regulator n=1 Tax=Atopobiaceae TaxID=1643824 RepID=UPI000D7B5851|nr:metal-dependent transcriptional regulator [Atopobiaceae bacterium]PWM32636.1 MAG: metal-dependent transcriptional regulator [Coriobacteriia bacterium]